MVVGLKQLWEYGYDNQYRLVHYLCRERLSAVEIVEGRYVYDPLGRRVGKQVWQSMFNYIECDYNRWRRHSACGGLSPEQFENQNLA